MQDESLHCWLRLTSIFSPGKLTVSFSSLKSSDSFWMNNNTDQKRLTESKQTHRRHITRENSAPLSWLVSSDFCFEEQKLQTSLCGAGLWFWTANSRDMLIGGFESMRIPQMPSVEIFALVMLRKLVLQLQDCFSWEMLEGLSSHLDGAWIHI